MAAAVFAGFLCGLAVADLTPLEHNWAPADFLDKLAAQAAIRLSQDGRR